MQPQSLTKQIPVISLQQAQVVQRNLPFPTTVHLLLTTTPKMVVFFIQIILALWLNLLMEITDNCSSLSDRHQHGLMSDRQDLPFSREISAPLNRQQHLMISCLAAFQLPLLNSPSLIMAAAHQLLPFRQ